MTQPAMVVPRPKCVGHGRLPRLRHTAAALGYPALRFSLRDPATIGYKKIAAAPRLRGTFPSVDADQPERRGVSWKAGGRSGCSVTNATGCTMRRDANSIRKR